MSNCITAALIAVVMLCFVSCGGKVESNDALVNKRDSVPALHVWDVSTIVSDSGITRFKLVTPEWIVYDRAEKPFWHFPKGVHFERFNENLEVFAYVDADSAIYYTETDFWELIGNVEFKNMDGEQFETELLYIDQKRDRIYTDRNITITQSDKIINGVGFESNRRLTQYTVLNPTGIIPFDDDNSPSDSASSGSAPNDPLKEAKIESN